MLIAKILITTIQVNLMPNPSKMWRRQHKFTWIVVIKIFAINLPSQPFLGRHLGFHFFFTMAFLGAAHFFLLDCFWTRYDKHSPSYICNYSRKITPICCHAHRVNRTWQEADNWYRGRFTIKPQTFRSLKEIKLKIRYSEKTNSA